MCRRNVQRSVGKDALGCLQRAAEYRNVNCLCCVLIEVKQLGSRQSCCLLSQSVICCGTDLMLRCYQNKKRQQQKKNLQTWLTNVKLHLISCESGPSNVLRLVRRLPLNGKKSDSMRFLPLQADTFRSVPQQSQNPGLLFQGLVSAQLFYLLTTASTSRIQRVSQHVSQL